MMDFGLIENQAAESQHASTTGLRVMTDCVGEFLDDDPSFHERAVGPRLRGGVRRPGEFRW